VIVLHLFEFRTHEEIAAERGIKLEAVRQRFSRAIRRLGDAIRLQALMTEREIPPRKQEVIGIYYFQRVDFTAIAGRLQVPEALVDLWLKESRDLIREFNGEKP
jgi:DNA-directed RNA polymerase specialized sigma24 family protein